MRRPADLLIACGLIVAVAGCSRSTPDWKEATAADTPAAYEQFVAGHPADPRAAEARARIEGFAFRHANGAGVSQRRGMLAAFVARFPDGENAPRARLAIESLDWESAKSSGALADLEGYLANYPDGTFASEARGRVEKRLADRPSPFRGLRRVRLRVEKEFTWENWNPEEEYEPTMEPFEPNVDFENPARVWLASAGLVAVAPEEPAEGELWIRAEGIPENQLYTFDDIEFPVGRYEGAELSGRIRLGAGPGASIERRFYGVIDPPEQISVTVFAARALPFNEARDAPFDRAALLPGSFQERLAELICAALGPSVLAGDEPNSVQTWNGLGEARMQKILAACVRAGESR